MSSDSLAPLTLKRRCIGCIRLIATCAVFATGLLLVTVFFRRLGRTRRLALIKHWSCLMLAALGLKHHAHVEAHLDTLSSGLIVANHISFIDILALNACVPASFVAKSEIEQWFLIGNLVKSAGTLFIERGSRSAAHRAQERICAALLRGDRIAIFPEGTTTEGNRLLPFHSALFQAAIDANSRVHCWYVSYTAASGVRSTRAAYAGETTVLQCLWATVTSPGLGVNVTHVATIDANNTDRKHLAHMAHRIIAHCHGATH